MLDHHAELISVAHGILARPDSAVVRAEARALDDSHDAKTAEICALLGTEFGRSYLPAIRTEHAAMIAPFAKMSTQVLPAAFRSLLAAHHGESVRAIDSIVPSLSNVRVQHLAQRLGAARQRDIQVLERHGAAR